MTSLSLLKPVSFDSAKDSSSSKPIHARLGSNKSGKPSQKRIQKSLVIDESKDFHSTIPSRMTRQNEWVVMKKHLFEEKKNKTIDILLSNHIFVEKDEEKTK